MEIKIPGTYRAKSGVTVMIESHQDYPIPAWNGYVMGQGTKFSQWTSEGKEISGHRPWNLIEKAEVVQ